MVLEIWQIVHMVLGRNGLSDFSLSVYDYSMHFSIFAFKVNIVIAEALFPSSTRPSAAPVLTYYCYGSKWIPSSC